MSSYKYLIIGGGVAGTTAAETIRNNDPTGAVALIGEEPYPLYSKVMLSKPNYFFGKIAEDKIWLKKMEWYSANNINYLAGKKATAIDTKTNTVIIDNNEKIQYEKLLIASGSVPRLWNAAGADKNGVFYLRTLDDFKKIKDYVGNVKKAAAIGGGFISFELCEILRMSGIDVTLILRESYFWEPILDKDSGTIAEEAMKKEGVKIIKNSEVKEVSGEDRVTGVILNNNDKLELDMIVVGIGTCGALDYLKDSGIEVSRGIVADEYLRTNIANVWTAGDIAEFSDIILEEQIELGNWVNAQTQGRVAALNMVGKSQPFKLVSSYNTNGFGINITFVGDVRPEKGRRLITRKSPDSKNIIQLFERFGELVGATLINGTEELPIIVKLIEQDIKITGLEERLADGAFDLKDLIK